MCKGNNYINTYVEEKYRERHVSVRKPIVDFLDIGFGINKKIQTEMIYRIDRSVPLNDIMSKERGDQYMNASILTEDFIAEEKE